MSTVWDKLRTKVKVTVDEAGLELEKQRKIYAVRKEIGQHEATIREIEAEVKRLEDQRASEFQSAGEIAFELQKKGKLGEKWQEVATSLEGVPELESKMAEEQGAIASVRAEIEKFREQIDSIKAEYRDKRELVREEAARAEEEPEQESTSEEPSPKPPQAAEAATDAEKKEK